ncbi:hypothetical protein B296_00038654 [Ensete ventricosum]|uniref:Uncharacterized protein n=1 Tax=Ensete ventricosum TaxID=4639 RepID=A0A426XDT1_ENSVE|nr:hypothetical protein B296_00038654 [Ensete ventricosum]
MVPQRRVFRVCTSNLASDESVGYQHIGGAVYHRGRILSASTSASRGRDLIIQRYDRSDWRVGLLQCSHPLKGARQVRGQGRVVERDEKATMSPEGLNNPKAKRRLERKIPCSHGGRRKRGRVGGEYRGKLQVPRQDGRAEAKELHKTDVDGLLIKIAESQGL